jgi:hypothetical protein
LNRADVTDPIYLALVTSKVEPYDKLAQFKGAVIMCAAGAYGCWPLRTAIPFRADPVEVHQARLLQQFVDGRMTFVGTLTAADLAQIDAVIAASPFIRPNLRPFLLP